MPAGPSIAHATEPPKPRLRVGEVRGLMLAAGWSSSRLAAESGVDAAYLGKLLRGNRVLGLSVVTRLVAAFQRQFGTRITIDSIVEYDGVSAVAADDEVHVEDVAV